MFQCHSMNDAITHRCSSTRVAFHASINIISHIGPHVHLRQTLFSYNMLFVNCIFHHFSPLFNFYCHPCHYLKLFYLEMILMSQYQNSPSSSGIVALQLLNEIFHFFCPHDVSSFFINQIQVVLCCRI